MDGSTSLGRWGWVQGASGWQGLARSVPRAAGMSGRPPLLGGMGSHWAAGSGVHCPGAACGRGCSASTAVMGLAVTGLQGQVCPVPRGFVYECTVSTAAAGGLSL